MTQDLSFFRAIPMAVFDTSGLSGTYQPLNPDGFLYAIKTLKIYNGSNVGVTISYDGVTAEDYFPAGSTQIFDIQANHDTNSSYSSGEWKGRQGQILYGTGSSGSGNFYIIGYY